jgi:hypothetical protein
MGTKAKAGYSQDEPEATACSSPEGRVSIVRWNLKGLRRQRTKRNMSLTTPELIEKLNPLLRGWAELGTAIALFVIPCGRILVPGSITHVPRLNSNSLGQVESRRP